MSMKPTTSRSVLWAPQQFAPEADPNAAPGRGRCEPAPRWSRRRFMQNNGLVFVTGLVFLAIFVISAVSSTSTPLEIVLALVTAALIAILYVGTAFMVDTSLVVRWVYSVIFAAFLLGGTYPFAGAWAFTMSPYLTVMIAFLLPWRMARVAVLVVTIVGLAVTIPAGNWIAVVLVVVAGGVGMMMGAEIETSRIGGRLREAEERIATLAVAAERERIARDLHDILGHSLTAIVVKAGLAARLTDADPARAKVEIRELETVARQAIADVRATAGGYRSVRLAGEIASARSVLLAAGVECEAPAALGPIDDATSEFFGYVVREGVTNVIRHAQAGRCIITVADGIDEVSVTDDGTGPVTDRSDGSGLSGLTARAAALGFGVTFTGTDGSGSVLRATRTGVSR